jgi:antitoxin component HigA of HigAB toxin-antitoxin module
MILLFESFNIKESFEDMCDRIEDYFVIDIGDEYNLRKTIDYTIMRRIGQPGEWHYYDRKNRVTIATHILLSRILNRKGKKDLAIATKLNTRHEIDSLSHIISATFIKSIKRYIKRVETYYRNGKDENDNHFSNVISRVTDTINKTKSAKLSDDDLMDIINSSSKCKSPNEKMNSTVGIELIRNRVEGGEMDPYCKITIEFTWEI